jgi:hypothetical protein
MTAPAVQEPEFIKLVKRYGKAGTARRLGVAERGVYARIENIERRTGQTLLAPIYSGNRQIYRPADYPWEIHFDVPDGVVLIGSDAHYWPGEPYIAHRAFVRFARGQFTDEPKAVIMNGDVFDGSQMSRHPPLGWENRPDVYAELEVANERLSEIEQAVKRKCHLIWPCGNHDCMDIQTECLTKRGWLRYCDLKDTDFILSKDGDRAVWSPINEIVSYPFKGELVRVEKTRMSMALTPNHRVLLKRLNWRSQRYDIEEYRRADDLPYSFDMPVTGQIDNPGCSLSNDQIALAGWILTDGCFEDYVISIYQSKPEGKAQIEAILDRLGIGFSRYDRQRQAQIICGRMPINNPLVSSQYAIRAADSRRIWEWLPDKKRLPAWAYDLSTEQFEVFLDAIVAGDGVWDGTNPAGRTCCVIYGQHEILSDIQAVAVTHNWRARLATDNRGDYRLCLSREPKLRIERGEIFREAYEGTVWCLRVPLENFMVRRNGAAYFTGNSRFEKRLAQVAPELRKVDGVHLKDHFSHKWVPCYSAEINNDVFCIHAYKGGAHHAYNDTLHAGMTTVTGDKHALQVTRFTDKRGHRWGMDCGMLADPYGPQFEYALGKPRNHCSGFLVLTFKGGRFLWPEVVHVLGPESISFRGQVHDIPVQEAPRSPKVPHAKAARAKEKQGRRVRRVRHSASSPRRRARRR